MSLQDRITHMAEHIEAFLAHAPEDWSSEGLANHLVRNQAQREQLAIDVPELISERARLVRRRSREAIEALRQLAYQADPYAPRRTRHPFRYLEGVSVANLLLDSLAAERILDDLED